MKTNEKTSDLAVLSILKLIKDNSSVSQAKLAEGTGYSRSTISINCEKLIRENLIVANSESTPNKKKNVEFMLNNELGYIIGIGMGGTTCRVGIYNLGCELIEITRNPVDLIRGPEATLNMICQQIDSMLAKYMTASRRLLGIGMGIPSPIKYEEGVAFHPAFMPGWHLFRIKDILQDKYGCPAFIDNEVNTMALEEYTAKRSEKPKSLLCIKIGTGIGAGLIFNGTIYRGENGGGGNLGHILANGNKKKCKCGSTGCIESIASVPAIIEYAEESCSSVHDSVLRLTLERKGNLTLQDIKTCADLGDRTALATIRKAGQDIGGVLGQLTTFLDPGCIIIAGRAKLLGPNYLYYIRHAINSQASMWTGPDFSVEFSELDDDSCATGAARLCIGELFDRRFILQAQQTPTPADM
mgnify:FL=1